MATKGISWGAIHNPPDWSSTTTVALRITTNTAPDAPTNLTATAGDQQVTLNWTAPANDGGESITDYEYEQNGSGTWPSTGGTDTDFTVTGLKDYLLFRALADLRRSWRVVLPNLEQCALLAIDYLDLDDIVAEDGFWMEVEIANRLAHPARRAFVAAILDYFRLEYAIHSENYLVPNRLKAFEKRFREQLKAPWTLDADEELAAPSVIRLDPLHRSARLSNKSMGPASSLGKYIKHVASQADVDPHVLRGDHYRALILRLMRKLKDADYLFEDTARNAHNDEVPSLPASH